MEEQEIIQQVQQMSPIKMSAEEEPEEIFDIELQHLPLSDITYRLLASGYI